MGVYNDLSALVKVVGVVAPGIATALGSPLAGVAVGLLAHAFGANPTDVGDIVTKIGLDPDANLKLKALDDQHSEALAKVSSTDFATEVGDREDARKYSNQYQGFLKRMAVLITLGFFGALGLMFLPVPADTHARDLMNMIIGILAGKWSTVVDFFFGSSKQQHGGL